MSAPIETFFASTKNLKTFEENQDKSKSVVILDSVEEVQLEIDSVREDDLIGTIQSTDDLRVWLRESVDLETDILDSIDSTDWQLGEEWEHFIASLGNSDETGSQCTVQSELSRTSWNLRDERSQAAYERIEIGATSNDSLGIREQSSDMLCRLFSRFHIREAMVHDIYALPSEPGGVHGLVQLLHVNGKGAMFASLHSDHLYIIHECAYSNSSCRCSTIRRIRRRVKLFSRRIVHKHNTKHWYNLTKYLCEGRRSLLYARFGSTVSAHLIESNIIEYDSRIFHRQTNRRETGESGMGENNLCENERGRTIVYYGASTRARSYNEFYQGPLVPHIHMLIEIPRNPLF